MKHWTAWISAVGHRSWRGVAFGLLTMPALWLDSRASAQQLVYYDPISVYANSSYSSCSDHSGNFHQAFDFFDRQPDVTQLFVTAVSGPVHASAVLSAPDVAVALANAGGGSTGDCAASGGANAVLTGSAMVFDPQGRPSVKLKARVRAAASSAAPSGIYPNAYWAVRISRALDEEPFYTVDSNGGYLSIIMPKLFDYPVFWATANVNATNNPDGTGATLLCDSLIGCASVDGFSATLDTTVSFEGPPGRLWVQLAAAASSDALSIVDPVIEPDPENPDVVVTVEGPAGSAGFNPLEGITPDDLMARGIDPAPFIAAGFFGSSTTTTPPTTTTSSTTARSTTSSTTAVPSTTSTPNTTSAPSTTSSTTTPTTTSSSTTTSLPTGCPLGASFASIACRVDALLALVRGATDLGPLQRSFVARVGRARHTLDAAADACRAGRSSQARSGLVALERQLTIIGSRTRTNRARSVIPSGLAEEIAGGADDIRVDVRPLVSALACP
jgi:hypothetical protein